MMMKKMMILISVEVHQLDKWPTEIETEMLLPEG